MVYWEHHEYARDNCCPAKTLLLVASCPNYDLESKIIVFREAGALWGAMIDYYRLTGDSSYNAVTSQALISQVGPNYDYMVPLRNKEEGNDDQAFWGFATMSAAEYGWPEPPAPVPSWLQLTINLWNTQVYRWDNTTCGGGLKWQIYTYNLGYDYKNSVSNGGFFLLSARLARYTGNSTYLDWAVKTWDWSTKIGLIDGSYNVYDGTDDTTNCATVNRIQFSYTPGIMIYGAAILYNYTNGSAIWKERTSGLLDATYVFFSPYPNATNIMWEQACEDINTCNYDQFSFKAYLSRFMWASTIVAPFTTNTVTTLLSTSAQAAAQSCVGPPDGATCGAKWWFDGWDGTAGPGQQLSALETIQGLLINYTAPPSTSKNVHLGQPPSPSLTLSVSLSTSATVLVPLPSSTSTSTSSSTSATINGVGPSRWSMATAAVGAAFLAFGISI